MTMGRDEELTPATDIPLSILRPMFVNMVRTRVLEHRLAELLVAKEINCPVHLCAGQEASGSAVISALQPDDYVFGAHRSHGHYLSKGGDIRKLIAEMYGKSDGCARGRGGSMHILDPSVGFMGTGASVAATLPMAAGTAMASQLRNDGRVTVSFFGDGTMEEGTFHESMNMAASRDLPIIFVSENNFYSAHLQLLERRAKDNLAKSADAHGMPGYVLDGNDALAVYRTAEEAVARARRGEGPTFLENRTYRYYGHVGPALDLDVGEKRKDELIEWQAKDPIPRLRAYLEQRGVGKEELDAVDQEAKAEVEDAVNFARQSPYPDPSEVGWYVLAGATEG